MFASPPVPPVRPVPFSLEWLARRNRNNPCTTDRIETAVAVAENNRAYRSFFTLFPLACSFPPLPSRFRSRPCWRQPRRALDTHPRSLYHTLGLLRNRSSSSCLENTQSRRGSREQGARSRLGTLDSSRMLSHMWSRGSSKHCAAKVWAAAAAAPFKPNGGESHL